MPKSIVPKKKVVAAKKTVKKDNVTDEICVICMDPIQQKNMASLDTCDHKYCVGCIKEWAKTENSCPQCKRKFKKITSLKKGCKKKKQTVEVEDKRQRPDHHGELTEDDAQEATEAILEMVRGFLFEDLSNAGSLRKWRVLQNQVLVFDLLPDPPQRILEGPGCVDPLDPIGSQPIWLERIYAPMSRINIMIFFMMSANFRHRLLGELADVLALVGARRSSPYPRSKIIAHMVFNVIHRFMLLNEEGGNDSIYSQWWRRAKKFVFGSTGEANNPIVLGTDTPPERPPHAPLYLINGVRCTHTVLKQLVTKINPNLTMDSNVRVYV